jgi:hypothetical protein
VIGAVVGCARCGDAATLTLHGITALIASQAIWFLRHALGALHDQHPRGYVTSVRADNLADETTYYFNVQSTPATASWAHHQWR